MPTQSQIREELDTLQLQEAREAAEERKQLRIARETRNAAIQMSIKRDNAQRERIQSACYHRKGGKNVAQIYQGNDANYAVVTHTFAEGITRVVCQRCGKIWEPPAKLEKNATKEQREAYRRQMEDYRTARNLPTDNEPSGTVLFAFEQIEPEAVGV